MVPRSPSNPLVLMRRIWLKSVHATSGWGLDNNIDTFKSRDNSSILRPKIGSCEVAESGRYA